MTDLVGTCPKDFWLEWIDEGDPAGAPYTGEEWGWYTKHPKAALIKPGDRFYVVAWGRLRGWAPVTRVERPEVGFIICRRGDAVACTIPGPVAGFRGLMTRWWDRDSEVPFPGWKTEGVGVKPAKVAKVERQGSLL